ncbi:uncharacterized protein LOC115719515 [Cannabis sativa]|uniref:uncharacterized protein LOC115719515 n=1 Tax=Cannabis sativa TaxID=3483 RepID=UPI0029CA04ED|nr:uncharacterized protein LOC115719515 [Cannabis sativa]
MMAVDLHRGGDLILSSSDQFHLSDINDDGFSFSEILGFDDPSKPWQHNSSFDDEFSSNGFSSPVSSSADQSETEQKIDDYCIAELTRDQMTHGLFDPDDDKRCRFPGLISSPGKQNKTKDFGVWGSNSSRVGTWSPLGSSYGSPERSSHEPTPPATPLVEKRQLPWDYSSFEITSKLEDLNIISNNEGFSKHSSSNNQNQSLLATSNLKTSGFRRNQPQTLDQIQAIRFRKVKQELIPKQKSTTGKRIIQNQEQNLNLPYVKKDRPTPKRHPWVSPVINQKPQQQQQQPLGSGMRAVFLGGSGSASGSSGTGVFLPGVIGETSQSRKKKGCSPVLIPAKVMQALKVHFDRMDNMSGQNTTDFFSVQQHDIIINNSKKNGKNSQKKGQYSRTAQAMHQNEIGLPQDWTY